MCSTKCVALKPCVRMAPLYSSLSVLVGHHWFFLFIFFFWKWPRRTYRSHRSTASLPVREVKSFTPEFDSMFKTKSAKCGGYNTATNLIEEVHNILCHICMTWCAQYVIIIGAVAIVTFVYREPIQTWCCIDGPCLGERRLRDAFGWDDRKVNSQVNNRDEDGEIEEKINLPLFSPPFSTPPLKLFTTSWNITSELGQQESRGLRYWIRR